jgi:hypothetical protein
MKLCKQIFLLVRNGILARENTLNLRDWVFYKIKNENMKIVLCAIKASV